MIKTTSVLLHGIKVGHRVQDQRTSALLDIYLQRIHASGSGAWADVEALTDRPCPLSASCVQFSASSPIHITTEASTCPGHARTRFMEDKKLGSRRVFFVWAFEPRQLSASGKRPEGTQYGTSPGLFPFLALVREMPS